jgi:glycosyltransferase involved in cell wall biosynthesis
MVVGPMLGGHAGHVSFVGEALASRLTARGYPVRITSECRSRAARLADIVSTLIRHCRRVDVQILQVFSGLSFIAEDVASSLAIGFGHKVIMHLHGGALPAFMARHPVWGRRVLGRAAAIVAPSPYLRRAMAPFGFDVRVIPNAIDLSLYPYRQRTCVAPRLLWMRTFHDVYNPEMAVRVLARVKQVHPEATLVMAGQEKGAQSAVRQLAAELGVDDGIRFPGYLDAAAKVREGHAADIFLNTNRIDNTPVSVIEACAMGLPVVATDVGGLADLLVERETGLLVPDDDHQAMAEAVLRLLAEPHLANRLSRQGRSMAERFSWEQTLPQWERLLEVVTSSTLSESSR